jgi:hypothetical protein
LGEGRSSRQETEQDNKQPRSCVHNSSPPVRARQCNNIHHSSNGPGGIAEVLNNGANLFEFKSRF